jgi:hypothetical protein
MAEEIINKLHATRDRDLIEVIENTSPDQVASFLKSAGIQSE